MESTNDLLNIREARQGTAPSTQKMLSLEATEPMEHIVSSLLIAEQSECPKGA